MTLFNFAANYSLESESTVRANSAFSVLGRSVFKHSKQACIRTNLVSLKTDSEGYYLRFLMLHVPFRSEKDLKNPHANYCAAFHEKSKNIDPTVISQKAFQLEFEKEIEQQRVLRSENIDDLLENLNETNLDESDLYQQLLSIDDNVESNESSDDEFVEPPAKKVCISYADFFDENNMFTMTLQEFKTMVKSLNFDQKKVFEYVQNKLKADVKSKVANLFFLYIGGKAGTGKSFLIDCMYELAIRTYRSIKCALKCAPTGVASFLIKGNTLHRSFLLPVDHGFASPLFDVDGSTLKEMRQIFRDVRLINIDELSMISHRTLENIHKRLGLFKDDDQMFGGVNMILLGDFHQLKPIAAAYLYHKIKPDLMDLFSKFKVKLLKIPMRRESNSSLNSILTAMRINELTDEHKNALRSRVGIHLTDKNFDDALRVFPTNELVDTYNEFKLNELLKTGSKHVIDADDTCLNSKTSKKNLQKIPMKLVACKKD